jgi:hypothetical protein
MLTLSVDSGTTYRYSLSVCFLEIGTVPILLRELELML